MSTPDEQNQGLKISLTQLMASALTAVTVTLAAATLGVAGTVIGAAVASVLAVVANEAYTHSIKRTRDRLPIRRTVVLAVTDEPAEAVDDLDAPTRPIQVSTPSATERRRRVNGVVIRRVALASGAVFLFVAGAVTSLELATGKPIDRVVQNQQGSGTTFFGHGNPAPSATESTTPSVPPTSSAPEPAPTVTVTVTPTPTPTSTTSAPTAPETTAPSAVPTTAPSTSSPPAVP